MTPSDDWENLILKAGPKNVMLVGFRTEALRQYMGMRLTEVAVSRRTSVPVTVMDLITEDTSRVGAVYFLMDKANVRRKLEQPRASIDSNAISIASEGNALNSMVHPRTHGSFARLLARYVREEQVLPLEDAIRRMTSLYASIFAPQNIAGSSTFEDPHQLATGMHYVFVNGTMVLSYGEHTGALPRRVARGSAQTKP